MPSIPELVYAALLYKDGEIPANPESKDFVQGTATEDGKLIFSFQRPDDTSGTFTLEICAFVKTEGESEDDTMQFSRETALLSGNKTGLSIVGDTIEISEAIPLSSSKPGTVSLKIKVPDECSLFISEPNEDGTTIAENDAHFTVTGTSPNFTLTQAGEGISAGAYPVTFTVKKGDEIVHIFSEYINVINGLCTNTWWNGEKSSEVKDVASSISKTVYVRGTGGYYDTNSPYNQDGNAMADDEHTGSFLSPLATIQKAIDKIIAINDGASAYTIYVDGKFTQSTVASENGMVDFSALSQNLTLTIKTLSGTATLDANQNSRVIYAKPASGILNLTLENLVITGGNASDNGGGIYFSSTDGSLTMNGGEISGNKAAAGGGVYDDSGKFTMTAGTIGGNTATGYGGGIYFTASNTLKISSSATISGNKAKDGGGIAKTDHGFIEMDGGEISGNTATGTGGGIYSNSGGYVEISGGTISGNKATSYGGGIYNWSAYGVIISGDAIIKKNTTGSSGGGIFINSGSLDVKGGEISGNVANSDGGGIYFSSTSHSFEISGGTIGGASDSDKNTAKNGGGVYVYAKNPKMSGGTISGNTASENGGGVYVNVTGTFTMKDGTISGNTANGNDAKKGGGGVYVASGTFTMTGGTISGNTAKSNGGGVYIDSSGTFKMSGMAKIAGCKTTSTASVAGGGGIYNAGTLTISGGTISDNTATNNGGGVYIYSGTLTMSGGTISDNTAKSTGGGVYVNGGTFNLTDGTIGGTASAEANTAQYGGGVYVYTGNFTMEGGTVSGNTATNNGGGVYVSSGTFTMKSGAISGNTTTNNGGGVYVYNSNFTMEGGEITDNTASARGGGVYAYGTFKISGSASIPAGEDGTNDVYLASGKTITVAGALTAASPVATITPSDYTAGRQVLSAGTDVTIGDTVCDKFALTPAPDGMEWKIVPNNGYGFLTCTTFYVASTGSDSNLGNYSHPFATIQKAVDTVIANNDTMSAYTIYVDGTLECSDSTYIGENGMADFSKLAQNLTLTIKALSGTATLDANQKSRVIYAKPASGAFDLTLENLVITGGNASLGGGIYNNGTVTITSGTISSCTATNCGGGVYVDSGGTFKMSGTAKITGCTVTLIGTSDGGGGIYNEGGNVEIAGGTISGCTARRSGGGICVHSNGMLTMTGGSISGNGNTNMTYGGGIYVNGGTFTMTNGTISGNTAQMGAGVRLYQTFTKFDMSGGEISGNTATKYGGGVYVNQGTFTKNGGEISGNTPDNVYTP